MRARTATRHDGTRCRGAGAKGDEGAASRPGHRVLRGTHQRRRYAERARLSSSRALAVMAPVEAQDVPGEETSKIAVRSTPRTIT